MSMVRREVISAKALGQRVLDNEERLREELESDSQMLNSIRRYKSATVLRRGCKGCRKDSLLRWLAREVQQLTGPEKDVVRGIVDKP